MAMAAVAMAGVAVAVAVAGGEAAVPVDSWIGGAGGDLWIDEVDVDNTIMIYRNPNMYYYPSNPLTLMNRYLNLDQDLRLFWSVCITEFEETDINYDDTVGHLTEYEIYKLRRNREIATALFSRIRFRETLFNPLIELLGGVFPARWVPRENWQWLGERDYSSTNMYEIVIRRGELTSIDETSFFGFIKEVVVMYIPSEDDGDDGDHEDIQDAEWDHFHEYVFVADVFTPTSFRSSIGEGVVGSVWNCHGEYDMDEGMVRLSEVRIRFSQVRRLYIMKSHEQLLVS